MRKQGAVPTFPASTMNDAVEAYQKGDCRESIRRFSAALQQQEHPALLNGLGMAYLSCNQPRNAAQAFERAVSISPLRRAACQCGHGAVRRQRLQERRTAI